MPHVFRQNGPCLTPCIRETEPSVTLRLQDASEGSETCYTTYSSCDAHISKVSTSPTFAANNSTTTLLENEVTDSVFSRLCHRHCASLLRAENPLPSNANRLQIFFDALRCPPHSIFASCCTSVLILLAAWGIFWTVFGPEAEPGGQIFAFLALISSSFLGGRLVSLLKLPPLLGMLLVGLLFRNCTNIADNINRNWATILRTIAMVVIILRAGIALRASVLKAKFGLVFRLSVCPNVAEATLVAVLSHFILHLPWIWAFMLGFIFSATSSAVVVPAMLEMEASGLGSAKGIPTIALAATAIDNVLSIAVFSILLGVAFSTVPIFENLGHAPLEIVIGIFFGTAWGLILRYFPSADQPKRSLVRSRLALLVGGAIVAVFGGRRVGYSGGGPLACIIMSFIAGASWRGTSGWFNNKSPIAQILAEMWMFFEAVLFVLIGAEINFENVNATAIGWGCLVLFSGVLVRCIVAYLAVMGGALNHKERLYISLSWFAKATVQATLGPMVLETARRFQMGHEAEEMGSTTLSLSVLAILTTAPLGALVMRLVGPRLLATISVEKDPNLVSFRSFENGLVVPMENSSNPETNL